MNEYDPESSAMLIGRMSGCAITGVLSCTFSGGTYHGNGTTCEDDCPIP